MKMKEMFTVESGSYSDHSVLAVFECEEDANAWRDALIDEPDGWNKDAYVGRIKLVPKGMKPEKVTTWRQNVELWDDGKTETTGPQANTYYPVGFVEPPIPENRARVRYVRAPMHHDKGGRLEVVGGSREVVEKVVSDRIAMWRAGAWAGKLHDEINEEQPPESPEPKENP